MKPEGIAREALVDELLAKERAIARGREKLKADTKVARDRIGTLEGRRDELLDLLDGREHVQPELPLAAGKKAAPPPLEWKPAGDNLVAATAAGTYCIEPGLGANEGIFALFWTPAEGRSKRIGEAAIEATARDLARKHQLENAADAILDNAGAGALTGKGRRKGGGAAARGRP